MVSIEYLDAVKSRYGWTSDYKLAQELEITRSAMSKYRKGKITIGDDICFKVADLLKIAPEIVLIDVLAERTKFPKVSKILHKTAKQLTSAAASLFITIVMLNAVLYPADSMANGADQVTNNVYYVK